MNILLLMSSPRSHITLVEVLIRELINKQNVVYCMSTSNNKDMLESYGAKFIEYPDYIVPASCNNIDVDLVMKKTDELWKKGKIKEGYDYITEKDIESVFDITLKQIDYICEIVEKFNINLMFRDAVDKLGRLVADKMNIKCIGYMTHNIYSKRYFEQNPNDLYAVFMNAKWRIKNLPNEYFLDLRERAEKLYKKYGEKNFPIYTHHQLDPMTEFTLIFSSEKFQPVSSFYENRKYLIIKPEKSVFKIEENIDDKLIKFIESYKKIIYISSGSFVTQSYYYYKNFVNALSKFNIGVVMAVGKFSEPLNNYIRENKINNIYISSFIPQKFILSKTDVFITSGGHNSILEAIYYKVPMLITPISSEQRMNGLLLEELGIGETTYSLNKNASISSQINKLLRKQLNVNKLNEISNDLRNQNNNFKFMWDYIYDN